MAMIFRSRPQVSQFPDLDHRHYSLEVFDFVFRLRIERACHPLISLGFRRELTQSGVQWWCSRDFSGIRCSIAANAST